MKLGILGSGRVGDNLGMMFARAGHKVTLSYFGNEIMQSVLGDPVLPAFVGCNRHVPDKAGAWSAKRS